MENTITAPALEHTFCDACNTNVTNVDTFCNNCGYPLQGTEQEQENFIAHLTVNEIDLNEYKAQITKGGNSFVLCGGRFWRGYFADMG